MAGSFYISLMNDLYSAVMLPYSSEPLDYFSFYEDGVYVVRRGSDWLSIKDGKFLPFADENFLEDINSQEAGDYKITNISTTDGFYILNRETGKKIKFEERRHYFRAYYKGHFYIEKGKIPKEIKCFDSDLKLVKSYSFSGQGFRGVNFFDKFLFYTVRNESGNVLEVFDLDRFEPIARSQENVTAQSFDLYQFNNISYLFIGKDLYLWNGETLWRHGFDLSIEGYLVKENFVYIGFEGDCNLYALWLGGC